MLSREYANHHVLVYLQWYTVYTLVLFTKQKFFLATKSLIIIVFMQLKMLFSGCPCVRSSVALSCALYSCWGFLHNNFAGKNDRT